LTLSEYSVRKPFIAVILIASVSLLGLFSVGRLPLLFLPEIESPFLVINANYKTSSPGDIETLVTLPIEGVMGGVQKLKSISSTSTTNSARIRMEFEQSTDMDLAMVEIRDRLDQVRGELPKDMGSVVIRRWQSTDMPILNFSIAWDGPLNELSHLVEHVLTPRLLRLEGVADVDVQGIQSREIVIDLQASLLAAHAISVDEITRSLKANNLSLSGGYLIDGSRKYVVRVKGEFSDIGEIARLPIGRVRLRDLGEVAYTFPDKRYYQRLNGWDAVSVRIYKASTANIVEVSEKVTRTLNELQAEPGMRDLTLQVFFDQAREIMASLKALRNAGIIGGVLAVVMLFLFLLKLRTTLIIALAIPISILCTFTIMFILLSVWKIPVTLNIISLSGLMLAVGMLVDNSVVVLENIYRHREEGASPIDAAVNGAGEVTMPVTAATLTTIIVFVPLVFTARSSFGVFMRDFGLSIVVALIASLFVSLTLIPLISSRLFTGKERGRHRVIRWLTRVYSRIIGWTLSHRWIALGITCLFLAGGILLFTKIEREFTPPAPSRRMNINVVLPRDYGMEEIRKVLIETENSLLTKRAALEIKMLSTNFRHGRGSISVYFNDLEESHRSTQELNDSVRAALPEIAGISFTVGRRRWLGGGDSTVSVELKGENNTLLSVLAEEVKERLSRISGVSDVDTNLESGDEEVHVSVDRSKARSLGLSSSEVGRIITSRLSSSSTGRFKTGDGEIPIRVAIREEDQLSLQQIRQLKLDTRENSASLGSLADFNLAAGALSVQREGGRQIVTVSANTDRRGMDSLQAQIEEEMTEFELPPGYTWQMGQSFRHFRESEQLSLFALTLALIFVYLVMASLFESFIHPVTILFSIPFSVIGVSILFYLTSTTLNSNSWLGIMVLCGVVVNNGIILVDHINHLRKEGLSRREAIITGGRNRLRPILMTVATTLLGLMPLVAPLLFPEVFGPTEGRAGQYGPIALALVGGLTTSTFLTLIITPTIYSLIDDFGIFAGCVIRNVRMSNLRKNEEL